MTPPSAINKGPSSMPTTSFTHRGPQATSTLNPTSGGRIRTGVCALNVADDEFYRDSLNVLEQDTTKVRIKHCVI